MSSVLEFGKRPRWLSPTAQLDRSHPLASGLKLCLAGHNWIDLVNPNYKPNNKQAVIQTQYGAARNFPGTGGARLDNLDLTNVSNLSIGWVGYWGAIPGPSFANDDALLFEFSANVNSNDGFFIDSNDVGNVFTVRHKIGGGNRAVTTVRPSEGGLQTWVVDFPFDADASVWLNGTRRGVTQVANSTQTGSYGVADFYLGSRNQASLIATCSFNILCIWERLLGDRGAQAFFNDPFQMLKY